NDNKSSQKSLNKVKGENSSQKSLNATASKQSLKKAASEKSIASKDSTFATKKEVGKSLSSIKNSRKSLKDSKSSLPEKEPRASSASNKSSKGSNAYVAEKSQSVPRASSVPLDRILNNDVPTNSVEKLPEQTHCQKLEDFNYSTIPNCVKHEFRVERFFYASSESLMCTAKRYRDGKDVIIKYYARESKVQDENEILNKFMRELRGLKLLESSPFFPNVVCKLPTDMDDDYFVLVVDAFPVTNLASYQKFSLSELVNFTSKVSLALEHAAMQGLIIQNLSPRNIYLNEGRVFIVDLSYAVTSHDQLIKPKASPYSAPENIWSKSTDLFSLGVILFELHAKSVGISGDTRYPFWIVEGEYFPRPREANFNPYVYAMTRPMLSLDLAKRRLFPANPNFFFAWSIRDSRNKRSTIKNLNYRDIINNVDIVRNIPNSDFDSVLEFIDEYLSLKESSANEKILLEHQLKILRYINHQMDMELRIVNSHSASEQAKTSAIETIKVIKKMEDSARNDIKSIKQNLQRNEVEMNELKAKIFNLCQINH
ncbi:kinase-like protein, partial [Rozella allomycis CSF55]